jgi:hypothetical protein
LEGVVVIVEIVTHRFEVEHGLELNRAQRRKFSQIRDGDGEEEIDDNKLE